MYSLKTIDCILLSLIPILQVWKLQLNLVVCAKDLKSLFIMTSVNDYFSSNFKSLIFIIIFSLLFVWIQ